MHRAKGGADSSTSRCVRRDDCARLRQLCTRGPCADERALEAAGEAPIKLAPKGRKGDRGPPLRGSNQALIPIPRPRRRRSRRRRRITPIPFGFMPFVFTPFLMLAPFVTHSLKTPTGVLIAGFACLAQSLHSLMSLVPPSLLRARYRRGGRDRDCGGHPNSCCHLISPWG